MQNNYAVLRYILIVISILILAGLGGWYYFLKSQTDSNTNRDQGRGLDTTVPSFTGNTGSTHENIAQTTTEDLPVVQNTGDTASAPPDLSRVSSTPTAGMGFVLENSVIKLNFVERANGNIFSADLATSKVERLTNTLMPKIYAAAFAKDGAVTMRSVDGAGKTTLYAGTLSAKKTPGTAEIATSSIVTLKGVYLAENIKDLAINPKTREIFYILPDAKVGVIGIRSGWDGTGQKRVLESGIMGWHPLWLTDGKIILVQYPAYNVSGNAYTLENTGALTPIIRNIPGLTVLPRSGSKNILYGAATNSTITLYIKKDGKEPELLPIKTIADKCVWDPKREMIIYCAVPKSLGSGNFIDNWLQGRIHTADAWWEVNIGDNTANLLFESESSFSQSIDVIQPIIDETGRYISFMNGTDLSLWMIRIPSTSTSTPR